MDMKIPIMIVDDDKRVLKGLNLLLAPKYDVVEVKDGATAIKRASEQDFYCIVLDVKMRGLNGFRVYKEIKKIKNNIPIIFYTAYQREHDLSKVLNRYRPYGYVEKGGKPTILTRLISSAIGTYQLHLDREKSQRELEDANIALRVFIKSFEKERNEIFKDIRNRIKKTVLPHLTDMLSETDIQIIRSEIKTIRKKIDISIRTQDKTDSVYKLSPKEIRVAGLIKRQKTTKEVAESMSISIKTVEFHRRNIRKKLGLRNTKENLHTYLSGVNLI